MCKSINIFTLSKTSPSISSHSTIILYLKFCKNVSVYKVWTCKTIVDKSQPNNQILWIMGMCFTFQHLVSWLLSVPLRQKVVSSGNTTLAAKCSRSLQMSITRSQNSKPQSKSSPEISWTYWILHRYYLIVNIFLTERRLYYSLVSKFLLKFVIFCVINSFVTVWV